MGIGAAPGSAGRHGGGLAAGIDAIAEFGVGDQDPDTGLFEHYEIPEGHDARTAQGEGVSWRRIVENWALLEADWRSEFGEWLAPRWSSMTWREFAVGVSGLLACDSRLSRALRDPDPTRTT